MMKKDKTKLVILGVVFAVILYACYMYSTKTSSPEREEFVTTGGMQNLGAVEYDLIEDVPMAQDSHDLLSAPDFADLVDGGNHEQTVQPDSPEDVNRPLERLQTLSDSYIPRVASKALPFSQAAAKPLVHSFSVNVPRVNLKGKLYEMNLSEAVRGSVPINYDPNVALINKSRHGPSDAYNPGIFTPQFDSMYNKLSGSYRNLPMYTAGAGQAAGVGGNGVDLIMDM